MENLLNKKFGRLLVLEHIGAENRKGRWLCQCDCGKFKEVRAYSLENGIIKSCGCLKKERAIANFRKASDLNRLPPDEAEKRFCYRAYRDGAIERVLDFDITLDEFAFLVKQDCFYCGGPPDQAIWWVGEGNYIKNGIDRIDNKIGYTKNNMISCCKNCNWLKNKHSLDFFLNWANKVAKNHPR